MLSFNSIIFTIFAVIAIWKGFSLLQRYSDQRQGSSTPAKQAGQAKSPEPKSATKSIELVPCTRCGAYVDPKQGCKCTSSST